LFSQELEIKETYYDAGKGFNRSPRAGKERNDKGKEVCKSENQ
jgi:hypothetical protein